VRALIAGSGQLPGHLAGIMSADPAPWCLCALHGYTPDITNAPSPIGFRIETLGSFLTQLKTLGVTQVCFAGAIQRPALDPSLIDAATLSLVPRMMAALQSGDDGALRVVLEIFEEAGFEILAAHQIAPDLLPDPGILVGPQPNQTQIKDALRGAAIVAALGAADIGQACVVAQGQALASEALPGTDWMLRSLTVVQTLPGSTPDVIKRLSDAATPPEKLIRVRDPALPTGGILFKGPKPAQDLRIDMPTIGAETIRLAAEVGLDGIVIVQGGVMVLDLAVVLAAADKAGIFLWVRPGDQT
jgi:DUF1009 family protein